MMNNGSAKSKTTHSFHGGFTLLEVLVSLSIVAVGIAAAAKMITQSVTVRNETEKRFVANLVSSNHINSVLESKNWNSLLSEVSTNMAGYEWKIKMKHSATPNLDIIRIDVSSQIDKVDGYGELFYYKANLNQRGNEN
ncbi:MAG: prepilin-type N-terminal cleavage/methylation domain-containing protein [Gammaproteobacteria bacterium]|nr:prepilin-type N-terminal cleavage/methylation domain-containing protein [Gammaproteobacteria bacterium]